MILRTGELEGVPVLLTKALAADYEEWWIELHTHGGTKAEGYLRDADDHEVQVQDESGEHPWGQSVSWDDVKEVVIP
jgi:hypothetical protein